MQPLSGCSSRAGLNGILYTLVTRPTARPPKRSLRFRNVRPRKFATSLLYMLARVWERHEFADSSTGLQTVPTSHEFANAGVLFANSTVPFANTTDNDESANTYYSFANTTPDLQTRLRLGLPVCTPPPFANSCAVFANSTQEQVIHSADKPILQTRETNLQTLLFPNLAWTRWRNVRDLQCPPATCTSCRSSNTRPEWDTMSEWSTGAGAERPRHPSCRRSSSGASPRAHPG